MIKKYNKLKNTQTSATILIIDAWKSLTGKLSGQHATSIGNHCKAFIILKKYSNKPQVHTILKQSRITIF